MSESIPIPPGQDSTSCALLAISNLALNLTSGRLHMGLPQNHHHTLIMIDNPTALELIDRPQLDSGFALAWQARSILSECAQQHPDLRIRIVWGKGMDNFTTDERARNLARCAANSVPTLKAPHTLRYLKQQAKLKAGSAWHQLLQKYYTEHPNSPAARASRDWQPHPKATLLKKLGPNRGSAALAAQTILGKGPFPTYLAGINDAEIDTQCLCGARESRQHILVDCPLTLPHCAAAWHSSPPKHEQAWFRPQNLRAFSNLLSYLPAYGRSGIRLLSTGQDRPPDRWWTLLKLKTWAQPWAPRPASPPQAWLIEDFSVFHEYESYLRRHGSPDDVFNFLFTNILSVD